MQKRLEPMLEAAGTAAEGMSLLLDPATQMQLLDEALAEQPHAAVRGNTPRTPRGASRKPWVPQLRGLGLASPPLLRRLPACSLTSARLRARLPRRRGRRGRRWRPRRGCRRWAAR